MDCGQRLIGSHVCPNTGNVGPDTIHVTKIENRGNDLWEIHLPLSTESNVEVLWEMLVSRYQLRDQCSTRMPTTSLSTPMEMPSHLPTYREAITTNRGITPQNDMPSEVQNILHHVHYSSDPEEARIHFELTSPSRFTRMKDQQGSP